jgi:hypothetical protein
MLQLPPPNHQRNCRIVSVTVPREVSDQARALVKKAGISLSIYVTELLRADLSSRENHTLEDEGKAA